MKKISLAVMMMLLSFDVFAASAVVKTPQTKILWCSSCSKTKSVGIDENSVLENYTDWYWSVNKTAATSIYKMNLLGWKFDSVIQSGIAGQYYVVFTK